MTCQDTNDGNGVCQGTQCKGVGSDCDAGNNLCCPTLRCKLDSASGSSKCARLFEEWRIWWVNISYINKPKLAI